MTSPASTPASAAGPSATTLSTLYRRKSPPGDQEQAAGVELVGHPGLRGGFEDGPLILQVEGEPVPAEHFGPEDPLGVVHRLGAPRLLRQGDDRGVHGQPAD